MTTLTKNSLLVVEDSEIDFEILARVIKKNSFNCKVFHCETGKDALELLYNQGQYQDTNIYHKPSLILLDLNLPGIDGKVVLERIKTDSILKLIPVVIFSTSSNPKDIDFCYRNGSNAYIIKPMDTIKLQEYIKTIMDHWLRINTVNSAN